jgi:hypothetical protein
VAPFRDAPLATQPARPATIGATGRTELAGTSLQALQELAGRVATGEKAAATADAGRTSVLDILSRGPQSIEDYFKTNVQDPALRDFERDVLPAISRKFAGNQFFTSERQKTDRDTREDLLTGLTKSRSELAYKARVDDTNAMLGALDRIQGVETLEPNVQRAVADAISSMLGAGETIRGQDQGLLEAQRAEELRMFGAENAHLASTREEALRSIGSEQQTAAATRAEDLRQRELQKQRIEQILSALGLKGTENIAFAPVVQQGSQGAIGGVAESVGTAALLKGLGLGCFVAREVYGISDPRWILFRSWMLNRSPMWFAVMYIRHGEWIARCIRGRNVIRAMIRGLMNIVISHNGKE